MFRRFSALPLLLVWALVLSSCASLAPRPSGNAAVPEPRRAVDLQRYAGLWYEQGRYEASFQAGCEGVTARYTLTPQGTVSVLNTCRQGSPDGPERTAAATARIVPGSNNAKLKVGFFGGLIQGDYWVLDRAPDYSWAIVGEPSGTYLWILTRKQNLGEGAYRALVGRAKSLGYDTSRLRRTQQ